MSGRRRGGVILALFDSTTPSKKPVFTDVFDGSGSGSSAASFFLTPHPKHWDIYKGGQLLAAVPSFSPLLFAVSSFIHRVCLPPCISSCTFRHLLVTTTQPSLLYLIFAPSSTSNPPTPRLHPDHQQSVVPYLASLFNPVSTSPTIHLLLHVGLSLSLSLHSVYPPYFSLSPPLFILLPLSPRIDRPPLSPTTTR
ncbi:MAG: hypothetical protein J3Q66DRAFT_159389 [Benniella sp.]|nr:MAG: hypothetical protein J3Q66DRAFT_159389 [Benniella sp.]